MGGGIGGCCFESKRLDEVPDWVIGRLVDLKRLCDFFVYNFGRAIGWGSCKAVWCTHLRER